MKTKNVLSAGLILSLMISGAAAMAQGRGHHGNNGNGNGNGNGQHHNNHDDHNNNNDNHHYNDHNNNNNNYHFNDHNRDHHQQQTHEYYSYQQGDHYHRCNDTRVVYVYNSRPERRVVNHYHYDRPRYVYYSDYDIYYDNQREVYISFTGRGWAISTAIPVKMYYADRRTIVTRNVEYYNDDFCTYLDTRRPGGRQCDDWR